MSLPFVVFLVLVLSVLISAERVAIQAGKSFCVFVDLKAGISWGVQFQSDEHEIKAIVLIDYHILLILIKCLQIRSPNKILYNGNPETYGSYSIKTEIEGRYSVCFENPSGTIQKVSFNFLGQDPNTPQTGNIY